MKIECIWEHNGDDTLLHAKDWVGAFARGENIDIAMQKMKTEIQSYFAWKGDTLSDEVERNDLL